MSPVSLTLLESQWDAAFERYRLAVRQFGSGSPEAKEQWDEATAAVDNVVAFAPASKKRKHTRHEIAT